MQWDKNILPDVTESEADWAFKRQNTVVIFSCSFLNKKSEVAGFEKYQLVVTFIDPSIQFIL